MLLVPMPRMLLASFALRACLHMASLHMLVLSFAYSAEGPVMALCIGPEKAHAAGSHGYTLA